MSYSDKKASRDCSMWSKMLVVNINHINNNNNNNKICTINVEKFRMDEKQYEDLL